MTVTVYSTPTCPYCTQVKRFLAQKGIAFSEVDVSQDAVAAAEMVRISRQRGVPVTVVDGQHVVGFDRIRLEELLVKAERPRLGASIADAEQMARLGRCSVTNGAYIGSVRPASVAAQGGLQTGDIIVSIAGQPIKKASDVQRLLPRIRLGQQIPLTLLREGQKERVYLRF